jgi:predicted O-linked N-acetylglucosamine transferase (SPINDLY family)
LSDGWRDAQDDCDEALSRRIGDDRIDILIDLAGHAPGGRLLALARKPAPVIVTWLDYFDTTGLETVDYLIGDSIETPKDGSQQFTEQVVLLDPCRFCYTPPSYAPEVAPAPMARNGYITFGSFNRLSKLAEPVIALWAAVLRALPTSRLLLKNAAFADPRTHERFVELFARHQVAAERLELRLNSPHAQMLGEYADVDIALDPFPYNGGLTTCEALWMGVPVLTLLGNAMISRQSAAMLDAGGLSGWTAANEKEFVRRAADAAGSPQVLADLRAGMRAQLQTSALLDARAFGSRFGQALVSMWEEKRRQDS